MDTQVGGAYGIDLLHHKLASGVEARGCPRERERDEQSEETVDGRLERSRARPVIFGIAKFPSHADAPTNFEAQEDTEEDEPGEQETLVT